MSTDLHNQSPAQLIIDNTAHSQHDDDNDDNSAEYDDSGDDNCISNIP